jgi:hypothetical protein
MPPSLCHHHYATITMPPSLHRHCNAAGIAHGGGDQNNTITATQLLHHCHSTASKCPLQNNTATKKSTAMMWPQNHHKTASLSLQHHMPSHNAIVATQLTTPPAQHRRATPLLPCRPKEHNKQFTPTNKATPLLHISVVVIQVQKAPTKYFILLEFIKSCSCSKYYKLKMSHYGPSVKQ